MMRRAQLGIRALAESATVTGVFILLLKCYVEEGDHIVRADSGAQCQHAMVLRTFGLKTSCLWIALLVALRATTYALAFAEPVPIVPGLRGFGVYTPAGSGRHLSPARSAIITVSSLADSGSGTLRDCLEQMTPRICVFEVGGEIRLKTRLRIRTPFLTVSGQTAPAPGITITGGGITIESHDILLQHIAVRPGDRATGVPARVRDGISIGGTPPRSAFNVVLDHLSLTWAIDENLATWDSSTRDVTIANSIIAEGLHRSIHPKGPHSKGILIGNGSSRITLIRNLIAFNEERNPYLKPGSSTEMINNVVYGWGPKGPWSLCNLTNNDNSDIPLSLSFIGNVYIPGPWSFVHPPVYAKYLAHSSRIYLSDNAMSPRSGDWLDLSSWEATTLLPPYPYRTESVPVNSPGAPPVEPQRAYEEVLKEVGSRPFNRSRIDRRIIRHVTQRSGNIRDCITGCSNAVGGWPNIRPSQHTLQIPDAPHSDLDRNGYTAVEEWLYRATK